MSDPFREQAEAYARLSEECTAEVLRLREAVEHFLTNHDEGAAEMPESPWCNGVCVGVRSLRAALATPSSARAVTVAGIAAARHAIVQASIALANESYVEAHNEIERAHTALAARLNEPIR